MIINYSSISIKLEYKIAVLKFYSDRSIKGPNYWEQALCNDIIIQGN